MLLFPPFLLPGEGPWLWRGVWPESIPFARGGPSGGLALCCNGLQAPRHPIMTSEQHEPVLHNRSLQITNMATSMQRCHRNDIRRTALCDKETKKKWEPTQVFFYFYFLGILSKWWDVGVHVAKEIYLQRFEWLEKSSTIPH